MWDQIRTAGFHDDRLEPGRLVVSASEICIEALTPFIARVWRSVRARHLEWSVWDTVVHINDDLYFYAAQVLLADESDYICFELSADDHSNAERLLAAFTVQARLLAGSVAFADPDSRAHHVYGASDPGGFAAMGAVESLIHTYDALYGLDGASTWRPPDDLAVPILSRLFPHAPAGDVASPGDVLLYMCGRTPLGALPRLTDWRWLRGGTGLRSAGTPSNPREQLTPERTVAACVPLNGSLGTGSKAEMSPNIQP